MLSLIFLILLLEIDKLFSYKFNTSNANTYFTHLILNFEKSVIFPVFDNLKERKNWISCVDLFFVNTSTFKV